MDLDLYGIADEIDQEDILPNFSGTEGEGDNCLRIDYGNEQSVWLYKNGEVTGKVGPKAKKFLTGKGFKFA